MGLFTLNFSDWLYTIVRPQIEPAVTKSSVSDTSMLSPASFWRAFDREKLLSRQSGFNMMVTNFAKWPLIKASIVIISWWNLAFKSGTHYSCAIVLPAHVARFSRMENINF